MAFDWKGPLKVLAPTLATALGGPMAGAAVAALSKKLLGKEGGTEEELAAVISGAKPEDLVKLKELELEFQKHMADLGVELERLDVDDRKSARQRQVDTKDWVPSVLALGIVGVFVTVLGLLFANVIPESNRDLFHVLIGTLDGMLLQVMNYEFGSSRSSRAKDSTLNKMADRK